MGTPSSFSITELSGAGRSLVLMARALPYQDFTLEGTVRADITWYPGNGVATLQVLGAEEAPTTVSGMWKDVFVRSFNDEGIPVLPSAIALFNGSQVSNAKALVDAVDSIRLAAQLVEVRWDAFTRRGLLRRFRHKWKRIEDVEWEMEFLWVSRGEEQTPPTLPQGPAVADFAVQLAILNQQLEDAMIAPFPVQEPFTAAVTSALEQIGDAVDEMTSAAVSVAQTVMSAPDAAERALAAAVTVQDQSSVIVDLCDAQPARSIFAGLLPQSVTFGQALEADVYVKGIRDVAQALISAVAEQGDTLRANVRQEEIIASFLAKAPTDLRDVSTIYYGVPDEWQQLMLYNGLTNSKLTAGQLILVPRIDVIAGG